MATTWGPTSIAATADDGYELNGTTWSSAQTRFGENNWSEHAGLSWQLPAIPADATITKMYIRVYCTYAAAVSCQYVIRTEASDPATAAIWSSTHLITGASWANTDMATQNVAFAVSTYYFGEADAVTHNLKDDLQDLITAYGAINAGDRINIAIVSNFVGTDRVSLEDLVDAGGHAASLYIEYTTPAPGTVVPLVMNYYRRLRS